MEQNRRLIDADALYDKAEEKYKNSSGLYRPIYRGFVDDIANAPTVDAVEVVRCKDCSYAMDIGGVCYCTYRNNNTGLMGYCHEGSLTEE